MPGGSELIIIAVILMLFISPIMNVVLYLRVKQLKRDNQDLHEKLVNKELLEKILSEKGKS